MIKLLLIAVIVSIVRGYPHARPDEPPVYIPVEYAPSPPEYGPPPPEYGPPPPSYSAPSQPVYHKDEPKKPYAFDWGVKDDYSGANYNHVENSDGNSVKGSYKVVLPDGRIQTVNYIADHHNGFQAQVAYEGEAQYPETKPYHPQPSYHPTHTPSYPVAPPQPSYPVEPPQPSYPVEPPPPSYPVEHPPPSYPVEPPPPSYPVELPPPPSYPVEPPPTYAKELPPPPPYSNEPPPPAPETYPEEQPNYLN